MLLSQNTDYGTLGLKAETFLAFSKTIFYQRVEFKKLLLYDFNLKSRVFIVNSYWLAIFWLNLLMSLFFNIFLRQIDVLKGDICVGVILPPIGLFLITQKWCNPDFLQQSVTFHQRYLPSFVSLTLPSVQILGKTQMGAFPIFRFLVNPL